MSTSFKEPLDFLLACSKKLRELLELLSAVPSEEKPNCTKIILSLPENNAIAGAFPSGALYDNLPRTNTLTYYPVAS
jgi:hypothetical protein